MFCCWKCGSGTHIGDKCPDQARTFDEIFNGSASDENFQEPTWAVVVSRGVGESDEQRQKQSEFEMKLKDENKRRQKERQDQEEKAKIELAEVERQRKELEDKNRLDREDKDKKNEKAAAERLKALEDAKVDAQKKVTGDILDDSVFEGDTTADSLLAKVVDSNEQEVKEMIDESEGADHAVHQVQDNALMTAIKHRSWLEERDRLAMQQSRQVDRVEKDNHLSGVQEQDIELDRIFGPGAAEEAPQLAIELQDPNQLLEDEVVVLDTSRDSEWKTSTPKRRRKGGRKKKGLDISPIREVSDESEVSRSGIETTDPEEISVSKKFKLDDNDEEDDEGPGDDDGMSSAEDESSSEVEAINDDEMGSDIEVGGRYGLDIEKLSGSLDKELEGQVNMMGGENMEKVESVDKDASITEVGDIHDKELVGGGDLNGVDDDNPKGG